MCSPQDAELPPVCIFFRRFFSSITACGPFAFGLSTGSGSPPPAHCGWHQHKMLSPRFYSRPRALKWRSVKGKARRVHVKL